MVLRPMLLKKLDTLKISNVNPGSLSDIIFITGILIPHIVISDMLTLGLLISSLGNADIQSPSTDYHICFTRKNGVRLS